MIRQSRRARILIFLFAIAQYAMPGVMSVADGNAIRDGRNAVAHVEDVAGNHCKPPHPADCGICRYLSTAMAKSPATGTIAAALTRTIPATAVEILAAGVTQVGFDSRAPPVS